MTKINLNRKFYKMSKETFPVYVENNQGNDP